MGTEYQLEGRNKENRNKPEGRRAFESLSVQTAGENDGLLRDEERRAASLATPNHSLCQTRVPAIGPGPAAGTYRGPISTSRSTRRVGNTVGLQKGRRLVAMGQEAPGAVRKCHEGEIGVTLLDLGAHRNLSFHPRTFGVLAFGASSTTVAKISFTPTLDESERCSWGYGMAIAMAKRRPRVPEACCQLQVSFLNISPPSLTQR